MSASSMRHDARGFTLIELMVAVGLTSVVAVGLYSLSVVAASTFNQQMRVSEVQLRLRGAMEIIRGDVARAGYMATPASAADPQVCPLPNPTIQGVFLERDIPNPTFNVADNAGIAPVHLQLTGNFVNTDEYRVMAINATQVLLQNQTPAYLRIRDAATMQRVFLNRTVRLLGTNGAIQFNRVVAVSWQPIGSAALPSLTLGSAPIIVGSAGAGCGIAGLGVGATIAPITTVSYRLAAANNDFNETAALIAGKTDLIREEMQLAGGGMLAPIVGTRRSIADFAVDFDVAAMMDSAPVGAAEPAFTRFLFGEQRNYDQLGVSGAGAAVPQRVRSLTVRLSVRDRVQDPDFGWSPRGAVTNPLTRFRVSPTQSGSARVRSLTTEIELPNIALRNLR